MQRTIGKLAARRASSFEPPAGQRKAILSDGGNLLVRAVRADAGHITRSWSFAYEQDGVRREVGLGSLLTVSLASARAKARVYREMLVDGASPLEAKRVIERERLAKKAGQAGVVTFEQAARMHFAARADGWSRKHRVQWISSLESFVFPLVGSLAVGDVTTAHVVKVLEPIWQRIPTTAGRVRERIESVLGFATVSGFRTGDNSARWRGHLASVFPSRNKARTVKPFASLPYREMSGLVAELGERNNDCSRALLFTIFTWGRTSEILGSRWSEVDFKAKVWTIPAERMKGGKQHRVPLSGSALEVLASMPRRGERIFPLSQQSMLVLLRKLRPGMVVHGLRASARTWASEQTAVPHEVLEQALAHAIPDATVRAYKRTDLFERRRKLMDSWAAFCAKPVAAGEVVQIMRRVP